jgi:hypothetical protein
MEIYSLNNLTNKYPSGSRINPSASVSDAYTKSNDIDGNRTIELQGSFSDNIKVFDFGSDSINIDNIIPVEDTSIKFIIEFRESQSEIGPAPIYYTSDVYYNELLSASLENNPYYSTKILDNEIARVIVPYGSYVNNISNNINTERERGIYFTRKHAFNIDGNVVSIDFEFFTRYIDWVVKSPSSDTTYFPLEKLYEYEIDEQLLKQTKEAIIEPSEESKIQDSIQKIIQNSIDEKIADLQQTISQLQTQIQSLSQ